MNIIFIIGQHRTGSTLLKNILDTHSQITMAFDEMNLFEPFRKNTLDKLFKKMEPTPTVFIDLLKSKKIYGTFWKDFEKSNISYEELLSELEKYETLNEVIILEMILELLRKKNNSKLEGIKYPVHFRKISYLLKNFPKAKIIFLTRNPKAIIASKINDPATKKRKQNAKFKSVLIHYFTLFYFCLEFNSSVKTYFKNKNNLHLVTYENLVQDKEHTVKYICDFCEVEFKKNMLDVSGKESSFENKQSKTMHRKSLEKYRDVLSSFDQKLIDLITWRFNKKILNEPHPHI
ncbi:MAG: sulfotransferase [Candidatus Delongbacteria bacterium]|jgi:hypothetical protein|nr:sulfotransferase [Candidatus Delongbacteria bacterium]